MARNQPVKQKRKANRRGRRAEWLAAISLRLKGYKIVERGFRTRSGEIDIIARKGNLIAIVEVKYRKNTADALDAVGYSSQHRIADAANIWLAGQRDFDRLSVRFDIIAVSPGKWPQHLPDAF